MAANFIEQFVFAVPVTDTADFESQVAAVWFRLGDCSQWPQWLPRARHVALLDSNAPVGRGTRLQVDTGTITELWEVSYWDEGKRVIFQVSAGLTRRAYAFETRSTASGGLEIVLEQETEMRGLTRLLRPFYRRIHRHRLRETGQSLQYWLEH